MAVAAVVLLLVAATYPGLARGDPGGEQTPAESVSNFLRWFEASGGRHAGLTIRPATDPGDFRRWEVATVHDVYNGDVLLQVPITLVL